MIDNIEIYAIVVSAYPEIIFEKIQQTEREDMKFCSYDSFIDNTVEYLIKLKNDPLDFFKNAFKKMYDNKLIYLTKDGKKEKVITVIYINKKNDISLLGHKKFVTVGKYSSQKGAYTIQSNCMYMP